MATIKDMVANRLPDEADLFAGSLDTFIEESGALAGFEGEPEADLSVLEKSLVADMAAKALILPAMSKYKKAMAKAEGEGAGKAEFVDKLAFLKEMGAELDTAIDDKKGKIDGAADPGVPLVVVTDE